MVHVLTQDGAKSRNTFWPPKNSPTKGLTLWDENVGESAHRERLRDSPFSMNHQIDNAK